MPDLTFDEVSHMYFIEGRPVPGVNEILDLVGLQDHWGSEADMMRGTYIHQACQYWDEGSLDEESVDSTIIPHLNAWKKFKSETKFNYVLCEYPLYSKVGFAGRPDRYGMMGTTPAIIDIKSGIPSWHTGLQLAAYQILIKEWLKDCQTDIPHLWKLSRVAVQLSAEGTYKLYFYRDVKDTEIFLAAVSIVNFKRNKTGGKY